MKFKIGQKVLLNDEKLEVVEYCGLVCTLKNKKGETFAEFSEDLQPLKRGRPAKIKVGKPKKNHNADVRKKVNSASLTDMNVNKITENDVKFKKYYIISATTQETKEGMLELVNLLMNLGKYNPCSKVYEITEETKVFKPELELNEE